MDRKKLIYGVIAVIFVIGIGISYYLTSQPSQPTSGQAPLVASPSPVDNGSSSTTQNIQQNSSASPEDVTKTFYDWYMNYPQDVIATRAYKKIPYLTDTFKTHIDGFATHYNPKFDPIFCTPNKTKNYVINSAVSSANSDKLTVLITDKNVDAPKPLYTVVLVQVNGSWEINDVMCE
ncbi:MAG TPA: hypothetical protein VLF89_01310 [Candidatus Saccharimonadales bacterium]|nr:hypothetical protein [Candidatus Saccharimonadales bacterium]